MKTVKITNSMLLLEAVLLRDGPILFCFRAVITDSNPSSRKNSQPLKPSTVSPSSPSSVTA